MISETLHTGWTLRATGGPVPAELADALAGPGGVQAQVPGTTHTDLLTAGLIPDPYLDLNETALEWMHRTDWRYETTFTAAAAEPGEHLDLVFEGLDTVATVTLNGEVVGRTANQHRSYRFDVAALLRDGENHLAVDFRSALAYAEEVADAIVLRPRAYDHPFNMVRKMACSFGWDWGPDLQTAGIFKPVRLERWTTARMAQVRPLVTVDAAGTGHVDVHVDLDLAPGATERHGDLVLTAALDAAHGVGDHVATVAVAPGARTAVVHLEFPQAPLWWPAGYGEHPLFNLTVTLATTDGDAYGTFARRIGFRTIEVDTTPDEHGTPFTLKVNGQPTFVKGANWIPDDHLLTRITREKIARRVDQALDANMNLLRIWGGGVYESEDFYDVCDERGVMVWQDFLMACAAYAEEEPLWSEVEAEARENVARLTPHASLVLWNGGNENLWGFLDWKWQDELEGRTWGFKYYTELFPAIVAELDPTRPYCEGSPYSPGFTQEITEGATPSVHPNDPNHGTHHQWEVWNRIDYTNYRNDVPRFSSEFGFQGPPAWTTLTRSIPEAALTKESPEFLLHQKAADGNLKLDRGLAPHLPEPSTFEDWHWTTQLNQAHAVSYAIEHYRSHWPRTAGSIVWQLNDCWPVTSWAAIDGDERPKPLFYGLRHAYADRLLTVQPREEGTALVAVNDHAEAWEGDLVLLRIDVDGAELARAEAGLSIPARSASTLIVPDEILEAGDPTREFLVAEIDGVRTVHYFVEYKDLDLAVEPVSVDVLRVAGGVAFSVTASSVAVDLSVLADRVAPDGVVDDMLVTVLPGESHTFTVTTDAEITDERLAELATPGVLASVLRSVNSCLRS